MHVCHVLVSVVTSFSVLAVAPTGGAQSLTDGHWHVTLETGRAGPIETTLMFERRDGTLFAHSVSGALDLIRDLPGARDERVEVSDALFGFTLEATSDGYLGAMTAPWPGRSVKLTQTEDGLSGEIDDGLFRGTFSGVPANRAATAPLRDYPAILATLHQVVAQKIFDPADLETAGYRAFSERMRTIAQVARDDLDMLLGFRFAWIDDPFSHFELRRAAVSAEALIRGFDHIRVGYEAARVEYEGEIAILTVETMMGDDTIEYIERAYDDIASNGAKALVIDLRRNSGGAFAVKPLVEHVIDEPLDAGYFMSHGWNTQHDRLPTADEIETLAPWEGWSIIAFWNTVQSDGLMKLRFEPKEPNFDGPVLVVVDERSASATELAADAFRASGLATLVGERTVDHMLSQSFFDVADGFLVSLPVADYFSLAHGRIEGVGVPPDIDVASDEALNRATDMARTAIK